jgi:hypothetical protein
MILNGLLHIEFKIKFVHYSSFLGHQSVCYGGLILSDFIYCSTVTGDLVLGSEYRA